MGYFFLQETTQHVSFVSLKQKKTHVNVNKYIIYIYILSIISTGILLWIAVGHFLKWIRLESGLIPIDPQEVSKEQKMAPRFMTCRFLTRHLFVNIEGP